MRKLILGTAAVALTVPAITLAGKKVTAGDQTLQIAVATKPSVPAKPGNKGVGIAIQTQYRSLNDNAQVKENQKAITFTFPKGFAMHADVTPACRYSVIVDKNQGESKCPDGSLIGAGTATADARPTLPDPVDAELHIYNGLDDVNVDGTTREPPTPAVILFAKTTFGVTSTLPFDIVGPNTLRLDFSAPKEGDPPSLFHVQDTKFAIPLVKGAKPYITRAAKCPANGFWVFKMKIENYDGPTVEASHKVRCKKPG